MKTDEDIVLQPGPRRDRDASLPDVDNAMDSDLELEPGLVHEQKREILLHIASQLMSDIG